MSKRQSIIINNSSTGLIFCTPLSKISAQDNTAKQGATAVQPCPGGSGIR
ncbi:hypothetical protein [Candidatus Endomicrobiellum agilis]|nr:hypothetical protein [Endomicrobium sp.]